MYGYLALGRFWEGHVCLMTVEAQHQTPACTNRGSPKPLIQEHMTSSILAKPEPKALNHYLPRNLETLTTWGGWGVLKVMSLGICSPVPKGFYVVSVRYISW